MGLWPGAATAFGHATQRFTDPTGYVHQALTSAPAAPLDTEPGSAWTRSGAALGVLSTALALLVACLGIWAPRLPRPLRTTARALAPVLSALRRLHSGQVADYIAFLLTGVVALAALIGLPMT